VVARPAGLEPATLGLEGRGHEATGGSVEPLLPFFLTFSHIRRHLTQPRAATDCQSIVSRLASRTPMNRKSSERRTASATLVPERQDLDPLRVSEQPVVDVVANSREVKASNA
jgi:hypothetical protein